KRTPPPGKAATLAATVEPVLPGLWEASVFPFLERRSLILALCLIAIGMIRIVTTYPLLSLTMDEPWHFSPGLEYLSRHVYRYETQHPPLSRIMEALGPYLAGSRSRGLLTIGQEGYQAIVNSKHPMRTVVLMR